MVLVGEIPGDEDGPCPETAHEVYSTIGLRSHARNSIEGLIPTAAFCYHRLPEIAEPTDRP
jgi:hypothetical protein